MMSAKRHRASVDRLTPCRSAAARSWLLLLMLAHDVMQGQTSVARLALEPETLKATTEAIGEGAVHIEINLVARSGFAFDTLTRNRDRGGAPRELTLPFAQSIRPTNISLRRG